MARRAAATGRRVVLVHPSNDLYGSDRMALESAAALADSYEVTLILPSGGPLTNLVGGPVEVVVSPFDVLRKSAATSLLARALLFLRLSTVEVVRATRVLRRLRPDAVYVNTVICPQWIAAARLLRCPVIAHVHEIEQGLGRLSQRLLLAWPATSDVVVANSGATASWIAAVWPRLARHVVVVHNGVARPTHAPAGDRRTATRSGPIAVVVGRLSERKGQLVAIRAFAQIAQRFGTASLVLVGQEFGGDGSYTQRLENAAARLGLADRVVFAGQTDDPWAYYDMSDVVVVPSLQEPFGNVAVEAGLAAKPVIASAVEGLTEIVDDGVTGLLVTPADADGLASALATVWDDADRATRMGDAALAQMTERFTIEAYRRRVLQIVTSCLADLPQE